MEKRLIDAYALETKITKRGAYKICTDDVVAMITKAPTVDAVHVVRCRECKHWIRNEDYSYVGRCELWNVDFENDFYCADSERREE